MPSFIQNVKSRIILSRLFCPVASKMLQENVTRPPFRILEFLFWNLEISRTDESERTHKLKKHHTKTPYVLNGNGCADHAKGPRGYEKERGRLRRLAPLKKTVQNLTSLSLKIQKSGLPDPFGNGLVSSVKSIDC